LICTHHLSHRQLFSHWLAHCVLLPPAQVGGISPVVIDETEPGRVLPIPSCLHLLTFGLLSRSPVPALISLISGPGAGVVKWGVGQYACSLRAFATFSKRQRKEIMSGFSYFLFFNFLELL
jgi:hypothetical protein